MKWVLELRPARVINAGGSVAALPSTKRRTSNTLVFHLLSGGSTPHVWPLAPPFPLPGPTVRGHGYFLLLSAAFPSPEAIARRYAHWRVLILS